MPAKSHSYGKSWTVAKSSDLNILCQRVKFGERVNVTEINTLEKKTSQKFIFPSFHIFKKMATMKSSNLLKNSLFYLKIGFGGKQQGKLIWDLKKISCSV